MGTDDTAADCGEAPGCRGFLTDAEGVESRVCSEDGAVPTDGEEGTFTCEAMAAEEGSAKLALGAAFLPPLSTCEIAVDRSCHFYDTCYHQRLKDLSVLMTTATTIGAIFMTAMGPTYRAMDRSLVRRLAFEQG